MKNHRLNLITVLFCTQMWICPGTAQSSRFAGYNFEVYQVGANLTISAASIDTTTTTNYTNVVFPNAQLPTQGCGDRFTLCDLTLTTGGDSNTKVGALAPAGVGAAVALFDKTQTQLVFLEQFFLQLPNTPLCSLTTFIAVDPFVYGFCYELTTSGEVIVQVYRILLNFNSLSQSTVSTHIRRNDQNALPYASRAFYFPNCSGVGVSVHWYTDAFLYTMRIDIPSSGAILDRMDTEIQQCFGNATQHVVQFQSSSLLAYCGANTTAEVDICSGLGEIVTNTRFYCSERRDLYLEVGAEVLLLINSTVSVFTIPFLLDMSVAYFGDCVIVDEQVYFIASSVDGTIILTNVLQNHTTILTMDAPVNHQVIENRFILYTNSTSSSLLDLSCNDPTTPIHENDITFDLATFSPRTAFSCFTIQPPTIVTTVAMDTTNGTAAEPPTNATTSPQPTTNPTIETQPSYTMIFPSIVPTNSPIDSMNSSTDSIMPSFPSTTQTTADAVTTGIVIGIASGVIVALLFILIIISVTCVLLTKNNKKRYNLNSGQMRMHPQEGEVNLYSAATPLAPTSRTEAKLSTDIDKETPLNPLSLPIVNAQLQTSLKQNEPEMEDTAALPTSHPAETPHVENDVPEPKFATLVPHPPATDSPSAIAVSSPSNTTSTSSQCVPVSSLDHDQDTPPPENRDHVTVTPSHKSHSTDAATQYEPTSQHSQQTTKPVQDSDGSPSTTLPASIPQPNLSVSYTNVQDYPNNDTIPQASGSAQATYTECAHEVSTPIQVQRRNETTAALSTSATSVALPSTKWANKMSESCVTDSNQPPTSIETSQINQHGTDNHFVSFSQALSTGSSDTAMTPVEETTDKPNNGQHTTVNGREKLVPQTNYHFKEHQDLMRSRDRRDDEDKAIMVISEPNQTLDTLHATDSSSAIAVSSPSNTTSTSSQCVSASSLEHDQDTPPPENRDHVTAIPSLEPHSTDAATQYEPINQHSQQTTQDSDGSPSTILSGLDSTNYNLGSASTKTVMAFTLSPRGSKDDTETQEQSPSVPFIKQVDTFQITTQGGRYCDEDLGIYIDVPEGAVQQTLSIDIGLVLYGPFEFPVESKPVSPVLMLRPHSQHEITLQKPMKIMLPHILLLDENSEQNAKTLGIHMVKGTHFPENGKYILRDMDYEGDISFRMIGDFSYATFSLSHFCFISLRSDAHYTKELAKEMGYCICPMLLPQKDTAECSNILTYRLVITYLMKPCIEAVKKMFSTEGYEYCKKNFRTFKMERSIQGSIFEREKVHSGWSVELTFTDKDDSHVIDTESLDYWSKHPVKLEMELETLQFPPSFQVTALSQTVVPSTYFKFEFITDRDMEEQKKVFYIKYPLISTLVPSPTTPPSYTDGALTINKLKTLYELDDNLLREPIKPEYMPIIAKHFDCVQEYLYSFGISPSQQEDICSMNGDAAAKVTMQWRMKDPTTACLGALLQILLSQEKGSVACAVCDIFKQKRFSLGQSNRGNTSNSLFSSSSESLHDFGYMSSCDDRTNDSSQNSPTLATYGCANLSQTEAAVAPCSTYSTQLRSGNYRPSLKRDCTSPNEISDSSDSFEMSGMDVIVTPSETHRDIVETLNKEYQVHEELSEGMMNTQTDQQ